MTCSASGEATTVDAAVEICQAQGFCALLAFRGVSHPPLLCAQYWTTNSSGRPISFASEESNMVGSAKDTKFACRDFTHSRT